MVPGTQVRTGYLDGKPFLAKLEEAQAEGNTEFAAAHMPRLAASQERFSPFPEHPLQLRVEFIRTDGWPMARA